MSISEAVKSAMEQKNINITTLAKKTGYSIQYISKLLLGGGRWNETTLMKACQALGLRIELIPIEQSVSKTGTE